MSPEKKTHIIVTCEHAKNHIPRPYQSLFQGFEKAALSTHLGYDPGALSYARGLAKKLDAALFVADASRMLVDLNRSVGHPHLFSPAVRRTAPRLRQEILDRYYLPYRSRIETHIAAAINSGGRVIHLSAHSFTPVLNGIPRDADIGLLYDPARNAEKTLAVRWQHVLQEDAGNRRVRRNYPYAGKSDGFTSALRQHYNLDRYLGIEIEVNQKHVLNGAHHWSAFRRWLIEATHAIVRTNR